MNKDASVSSSSGLVSASPVFSDEIWAHAYGIELDEPLVEPAPVVNPRSIQALEEQLAQAQIVAKECTEDAIEAREEARRDRLSADVAWNLAFLCIAAAILGWVKWWVK